MTAKKSKVTITQVPEATNYKHSKTKPRMSFISPLAQTYLALALTKGAEKYPDHAWKKGIKTSLLIDALDRHLAAYKAGIDLDADTGLPHMAHIMANAMFLIDLGIDNEYDDRYHLNPAHKNLLEELLANKN